MNLDPQIETRDDKPLHWVGRWNDPTILGAHVRRRIQSASSGKVLYHVVEYLEVDGYPRFRDGYEYNDEDYLAAWVDQTAPPHEGSASYADLFEELDLSAKIAANDVSEVWIWSPPGTGLDEYAEKFPGDLCYYQTDNPWFYRPYDIPEQNRTVFVMGWNYERGEGEALESYTHRIEGTLSLVVGKGIWDPLNHRDNPWNRFTIFDALLPGEAEVGNVHYPPNGIADYDYANETFVPSRADDWFNYPNFTGAVSQINRDSWSGISADSESIDYHTGYLAWWMNHLPRNDSELDGFHNNWWRYIADYDNAVESLPPPDGNLRHCETGMYAK